MTSTLTWTHGYNAELGYTFGYYREMAPTWLELTAAIHGVAPPSLTALSPLRYLELGCGQGYNLILHAALHPHVEFTGIDLLPRHIAHAQHLVAHLGLTNIRFFQGDILRLLQEWPSSLGPFHYIAAHGIYSWVTPEVGRALLTLIDRHLLPGGLCYLSYNVLPGWLTGAPIRALMQIQTLERSQTSAAIPEAIQRLNALLDLPLGIVAALPPLRGRIERLRNAEPGYLAQEYLNAAWRLLWFHEIHAEITQTTALDYIGTLTAADWFLPSALPPEARAWLDAYTHPAARQTALDLLTVQSFRRDLWVKGPLPLWPQLQQNHLAAISFTLLRSPPEPTPDGGYRYLTALGELTARADAYSPLFAALAAGPKTIAQLLALPDPAPRGLIPLLQALGLMLHADQIAILPPRLDPNRLAALNAILLDQIALGAPYRQILAPRLGAVVTASDIDLLALDLLRRTPTLADNPEALAQALDAKLRQLHRTLTRDGLPITDPADHLARSRELTQTFLTQTRPLWQNWGLWPTPQPAKKNK
ncbi:MAG: class I SAM-dependent methyltransferase [Hydrogenophilus sp.]|nr:class I SAM-dependent methyltransferase [Hydrogenophilus sp.]